MLNGRASRRPVPGPPASDARSDATLSHPPVASGLVPDGNPTFSHTPLGPILKTLLAGIRCGTAGSAVGQPLGLAEQAGPALRSAAQAREAEAPVPHLPRTVIESSARSCYSPGKPASPSQTPAYLHVCEPRPGRRSGQKARDGQHRRCPFSQEGTAACGRVPRV